MKREHIPENVLRFTFCYANQLTGFYVRSTIVFNGLRDSSDGDCVLAELRNFFFVHMLLSLLLNEFLQSEIMQKLRSDFLL